MIKNFFSGIVIASSIALGSISCSKKEPLKIVINDLMETCKLVEENNPPCGYNREGNSIDFKAGFYLSHSNYILTVVDKALQEKTSCRLSVWENVQNGAVDYFVEKKSCQVGLLHPHKVNGFEQIYP